MRGIARAIILLAATMAAGPAAAGSWSFGVGVDYGPPVYYGPPPVYYAPPPVVYDPGPPVYYEPPVVVAPAPPPVVVQVRTPDEVLDSLEAAGYRELGPMAHRGDLYRLRAVNLDGDLVALEISTYSGAIERELILEAGRLPPAAPLSVAAPPVVPGPAPASGDPLVVY